MQLNRSTVRPTVHTNLLRKRSISLKIFKLKEFENVGFSFLCEQKRFWKRRISKTIIMYFHKSKVTGDCYVLKFLRRNVDGKHLMRFQSENAVIKVLRCNVTRALNHNIFQCFALNYSYATVLSTADSQVHESLFHVLSKSQSKDLILHTHWHECLSHCLFVFSLHSRSPL